MATVEAPEAEATVGSALPDLADVQKALAPALSMLSTASLPSPDDLRVEVEKSLAGVRDLVPEQIPAVDGVRDGLAGVLALVPDDPAQLLGRIDTAVGDLLAELAKRDPFAPLHRIEGDLRELERSLTAPVREAAGPYAAALDRVAVLLGQAALEQLLALLAQSDLVAERLPETAGDLVALVERQLAALAASYEDGAKEIVERVLLERERLRKLLGTEGYALAVHLLELALEDVARELEQVDLDDEAAAKALTDAISALNGKLEKLGRDLDRDLGQVRSALQTLDAAELRLDVRLHYEGLLAVEVRTIDTVSAPALEVLRELRDAASALDVAGLQASVSGFLGELTDFIHGLEIDKTANGITDAVAFLNDKLGDVEKAVVQAGAELQSAAEAVKGEIAKVDVKEVKEALKKLFEDVEKEVAKAPKAYEDLRKELDSALGELEKTLDPDKAKEKIVAEIEKVVQAIENELNELKIEDAIKETKDGIKELLAEFDAISFEATADPVVEAIEDLRAELDEIDSEALSEALKILLGTALKVLQDNVDVFGKIRAELVAAFDEVKKVPVAAAAELTAALDEVKERADELKAEPILKPLIDARKELQQALASVQPKAILEPLNGVFDDLFAEIDAISPHALVVEIEAAYDELLRGFERLAPDTVFAPLVNALEPYFLAFRHDIREVADWVDDVASTLSSARDAAVDFGPADHLQPLAEQWADVRARVLAVVDDALVRLEGTKASYSRLSRLVVEAAVTVEASLTAAVKVGYTQVATAVASIAPDALLADMRAALDDVLLAAGSVDPGELAGVLASHYAAVSAAFGQIRKDRLKPAGVALHAQVDRLLRNANPVPALAAADATHRDVVSALERLRDALQPAELVDVYDALRPQLEARVPAYVSESPSGETIRTEWEKLDPAPFVDEARAILQEVRTHVLAADPQPVVAGLENAYSELRADLEAIDLSPLSSLAGTLERFREEVGTADLDIVLDPLEEVYEAIAEKLVELTPDDVLADFELQFEQIKTDIKALDPRLVAGDIVGHAEAMLKKIDGLVAALDPAKLLGEPIDRVFARVRAILESLYPEELLEPLLASLDEMRDELVEALDRVERKLDEMFAAVPVW